MAQRLCARWRRRGWPLRLRWQRLTGAPGPGDSIEAWARAGRYAALAQMAGEEGAGLVLLAQHRRDQAETLLLQALRGGGPAGLSAMPARTRRHGLVWARPWLDQPREAIEAYLRRHRLRPVEDPSNSDPRLARSRLRLQVWPALLAAFGDAEVALAGAARRAQEANAALAELATLDLAGLVDGEGRLQVMGWRKLSPARQANALRAWWTTQCGRGLPDALLQRLLAEVPASGAARWPAGRGAGCVLYHGCLHYVSSLEPARVDGLRSLVIDLSRPGRWPAPGWGGCFEVSAVGAVGGTSPGLLGAVRLRPRRGAERFQLAPRSLPRSLKKQYQAAGVPEHARAGPLLWIGERLFFAPGLGIDARFRLAEGEPGVTLRWCADPGTSAQHKLLG
jgi:tRNA(Ile)-lysidine synthase